MGAEVRLDPAELPARLADWLAGQRWFPARMAGEPLEVLDTLDLTDPAGEAAVVVVLLGSVEAGPPWLQVPVVARSAANGPDVHDGAADPAFVRAWLAAAGVDPERFDTARLRPVSGEQSNSSVVLTGARTGAILKVFRGVWPGPNPDVDVPRALARAGWRHAPEPLGWLEHRWTVAGELQSGHLGVLSRFVPGADDGFELATAMAGAGRSFEDLAAQLGTVVAEMHAVLARVLPVAPPPAPGAMAASLADRLGWAVAAVPSLDEWAPAAQRLFDQVGALESLPPAQRIHGDLHLGQVLRSRQDWFVLDFEGEPLVPLADRARPDLALRDVAGVLRSFDYVVARTGAHREWASTARDAFRSAYVDAAAPHPTTAAVLLRAFEVDKALYEAVYESRHRPAWLSIPRDALARLLGRPTNGAGQ